MKTYRVKSSFADHLTGRHYDRNDAINLTVNRAVKLRTAGIIGGSIETAEKPMPAPATPEPFEDAVQTQSESCDVSDYHTGGGWYTMPDGARIQGRGKAEDYLNEI